MLTYVIADFTNRLVNNFKLYYWRILLTKIDSSIKSISNSNLSSNLLSKVKFHQ